MHLGPQNMSPWRREVLKQAPTCSSQNDLSLLSAVSSMNGSLFGVRDTQTGSSDRRRPHARGKLNIEVDVCEGFLKVFIGGVKDIRRHDLTSPCYFVQLSVIPQDNGKVNTLVTSMKHQHDPEFNEVFEVTPRMTSGRPRLLIEVMSIGQDHRRHLVGCTSFGIRSILKQQNSISGWYYLLNDELGYRKHFRVKNQGTTRDVHSIESSTTGPDLVAKEHKSPPQLSPARLTLQNTYMGPAIGSLESLGFVPRYDHDIALSSIQSGTSNKHRDISSYHSTSSLSASLTSADYSSDNTVYSTRGHSIRSKSPYLSSRVGGDFDEDEGPSEHWGFLAAFDNFRPVNTTTFSSNCYQRQGSTSSLYWQTEFIWNNTEHNNLHVYTFLFFHQFCDLSKFGEYFYFGKLYPLKNNGQMNAFEIIWVTLFEQLKKFEHVLTHKVLGCFERVQVLKCVAQNGIFGTICSFKCGDIG